MQKQENEKKKGELIAWKGTNIFTWRMCAIKMSEITNWLTNVKILVTKNSLVLMTRHIIISYERVHKLGGTKKVHSYIKNKSVYTLNYMQYEPEQHSSVWENGVNSKNFFNGWRRKRPESLIKNILQVYRTELTFRFRSLVTLTVSLRLHVSMWSKWVTCLDEYYWSEWMPHMDE